MRIFIFIFLISFIFLSCGQGIEPSALTGFINNPKNGYVQKLTIANFELKCKYMPLEFQVVNTLKKNDISKQEFEKTKEEFGNSQYFHLSFIHSPESSFDLPNVFIANPENYISLIIDKDTLLPLLTHVQTYGVRSTINDVFVAFDGEKSTQKSKLKVIYNTDSIAIFMDINPSLRNPLPPLKLK